MMSTERERIVQERDIEDSGDARVGSNNAFACAAREKPGLLPIRSRLSTTATTPAIG